MTMRIQLVDDRTALDRAGADLVAGWLAERPDALLVPALGDSALGIYAELGRRVRDGRLDTTLVTLAQLDAYLGITQDDPRSLYAWLLRDVGEPLAIPEDRVLRLAGDASEPDTAARDHAAAIAAHGGIDIAILGLGLNGHLGFNEPPSSADAPTRVVTLSAESLASSATYWGGRPVPERALTVGMHELLTARHTLLVVDGERKRDILRRVLAGPPSADLPASLLSDRPGVTLLADRAAWPDAVAVPSAAR
jgi:glucosamine-6-phosphate deaminase